MGGHGICPIFWHLLFFRVTRSDVVAVFLTINDELPNTELEKIVEVLPRIEVPLI